MIVEKLDWLRHAGLQIFSLDIQPDGSRFATAGGDHKVRIWSMSALQSLDNGALQPRLLATLRDHFGSVNCVRWAKGGQLIASGSDDELVLLHKRHPGSGTTEFGSGEAPDVENWKNILTLRGHSSDVVDLGWSPDDSMIASCSLDNSVRIWSAVTGSLISVLSGHQSLVKGVCWDPVGSYLASQSDDKTVIVWDTDTWDVVHKAEGPWEKTVGSTFFRRLSWSPCGHFITTTHGFQDPSHTAPVLERGEWCSSFDFVGHNAPVVAVRYNHSLFRKVQINKASHDTVGGTESSPMDTAPYNVVAMGSQDCNITVWTTASPRPVFVGKHFFTQSVVDLSWSTDGYTLLCCSLDGTVAMFSFESKELGFKIPDGEMETWKKLRYGDVHARRVTLVKSPSQLALEAAATKQLAKSAVITDAQETVQEQTLEVLQPNTAVDRRTRVLQQTEYRGADGRRRIIPKALEQDYKENEAPSGLKSTINEGFMGPAGSKNLLNSSSRQETKGKVTVENDGVIRQNISVSLQETEVVKTNGSLPDHMSVDLEPEILKVSGEKPKLLLQPPTIYRGVLSYEVPAPSGAPVLLEARHIEVSERAGTLGDWDIFGEKMSSDIVCSQGGEVLWSDQLKRRATILAGNLKIWVVACEDNSVQVYTAAGRRALPSIILSSPAAFIDCNMAWRLLLLSCDGALLIWDLQSCTSILRESVLTILSCNQSLAIPEGGLKVISARITEAGAPLITLQNRHVFLFHMDLQCWLRVADSIYISPLHEVSPGVTSKSTKNDVVDKAFGPLGADGLPSSLAKAGLTLDNESFTRGQLESQMAASVALQSADEYRKYLLAYAQCLTKNGDKARLRELCEELIGPRAMPETINNGPFLFSKQSWSPHIMGMKKRDLLKQDVLPAMASNKEIQKLLDEFLGLFSEVEGQRVPMEEQEQVVSSSV